MSSKTAYRDKSTNKKESETALSAHQLSRSLKLQNSKPKVSPFTLSNIQFTEPHKEIKAIQDINVQFVELYHNLFQGKKEEFLLHDSGVNRMFGKDEKMNQEQRYQLECMKALKKIEASVQRIRNVKSLGEDLEKIEEYFIRKKEMGESNEYPQKMSELIEHYEKVSNNLKEIEPIHKRFKEREMNSCFNFEPNEDTTLTQKERRFKSTQRKLTRVLEEEKYYENKCKMEEKLMEEIQYQIRKSEQTKNIMQMYIVFENRKLVGEQAKTDRMLRKRKEKKDKDLSVQKTTKMENKIRSKSAFKLSKPI